MLSDFPLPNTQVLSQFPALLLVLLMQGTVVLVPKGPGIRAQLALGGLSGSPAASGVAQPTISRRRDVKEC